MEAIRSTSE